MHSIIQKPLTNVYMFASQSETVELKIAQFLTQYYNSDNLQKTAT